MSQALTSINPDAKIGENVEIGPFTTIYGDVEIGDGTWIGPNVTIMDGARIGKNCKIFPGAVISAIPQDLKFVGEITTAVIGDNTTVRECVTVNRGTNAKKTTIVGSDCLLMAYTHVAHDSIIGDHVILVNGAAIAGEVIIEDWVIIGGFVGVHQFVRVGKHAMVSSNCTLVNKDVPPYVKVAQTPCAFSGINLVGLRRRNFTKEEIDEIHDIYRVLYQKKLNTTQALEHLKNNFKPSVYRDEIIDFVAKSERGIVK
jgi:UDP-N-acetylglucosamine acyltransferase